MSTTTVTVQEQIALGAAVPALTAYAISVSFPTWEDNIDYEEGDKRVLDAMVSGYPRYFIHLNIRKLAHICEKRFGAAGEQAMLFPSRMIADECRAFMMGRASQQDSEVAVRLVRFVVTREDALAAGASSVELHVILFPAENFPLAKQFWQHTGLGISSRFADRCLFQLADTSKPSARAIPPPRLTKSSGSMRHYVTQISSPPLPHLLDTTASDEHISDLVTHLEERYGRYHPAVAADSAKRAIRRRIASIVGHDTPSGWPRAGEHDTAVAPIDTRGTKEVSEHDVYLYPTGSSAIWAAHQLALGTMPLAKSVCFGFPYTDTLKTLEKWGPGCHFFGHGLDRDIDDLEAMLEREREERPDSPPILALFTEFPSNPLLRSADLPRLRTLADKYEFLLIVDDTLGNFANVEVLPYADLVVTSLSKVFSGTANVMGGSVILNPKRRYYSTLKAHLSRTYEDTYFGEDAICMERNSRDFRRRSHIIDANTEAVCDFLRSHPDTIKNIFYPKYITPDHYNKCRVPGGGYGGLFSMTFHDMRVAKAFFNALPCSKGPSLGTNFTLACPYAILAHYAELDWVAEYGVEAGLVRVSVGMEDREELMQGLENALRVAREVAQTV